MKTRMIPTKVVFPPELKGNEVVFAVVMDLTELGGQPGTRIERPIPMKQLLDAETQTVEPSLIWDHWMACKGCQAELRAVAMELAKEVCSDVTEHFSASLSAGQN